MHGRSVLLLAVVFGFACDKATPAPAPPPDAPGVAARSSASAQVSAVRSSASAQASAAPVAVNTSLRLKRTADPKQEAGLSFSEYAFESDATAGVAWVVRLDLKQTKLVLAQSKKPGPLSEVLGKAAPQAGAYAAINGGFYGRDEQPMGWVVADGRELAPKTRSGGSGIFLLTGEGASVVHRDATLPKTPPLLALQSIDRLVDAGKSLVKPRPAPPRDARSAVAVLDGGSVLFVVAFDRQSAEIAGDAVTLNAKSTSSGMTLAEFAEVLALPEARGGLGAKTAMNLDGGFSTSMQLRVGDTERRVVAHRATTNALLAAPR